MAKHFINDDFINCYACIDICPREAIRIQNDSRVIDSNAFTDCGACDDVCPAETVRSE